MHTRLNPLAVKVPAYSLQLAESTIENRFPCFDFLLIYQIFPIDSR